MAKILSDSSSLYTKQTAEEKGIDIAYLTVTIQGDSYRENEDIQTGQFIDMIDQGFIPTTAEPAVADLEILYKSYPEEELVNITIASGLSNTFNSAIKARELDRNPERIHVINSKTLCGPQRYIVDTAAALAKAGYTAEEIIKEITPLTNRTRSYLIPQDFDFLSRGGRLSPFAGKISGLVKLFPVMSVSQDGSCLEKFITTTSLKKAVQKICSTMQSDLVTSDCKIYIAHALNESLATEAKILIQTMLPGIQIELVVLGPAFTTHGGPGCIAIQWIQKHPIMG